MNAAGFARHVSTRVCRHGFRLLGRRPIDCVGAIVVGLCWTAVLPAQQTSDAQRAADAEAIELRIIDQQQDLRLIDKGRRLFVQEWTSGVDIEGSGDGLGPMRNESSCVACHAQGKTGGGGPMNKNVELLSVVPPKLDNPSARLRFAEKLPRIHPGMSLTGAAIVLHRFSDDPDYDSWKDALLGKTYDKKSTPLRKYNGRSNVTFQVSQRNTPALFGAGLIDTISAEALADIAREQPKQWPGVTGRVARTPQGGIGRFGWRGQTSTLRDFVLAACATELGLDIDGHKQAVNPQDPKYAPPRPDLNAEQCDALVAFVANLPQPRQVAPTAHSALVESGEMLFNSTGCVACHVKSVSSVRGIYSDLLLHDMGRELSDPVPAAPEVTSQIVSSGSYYGGSVGIFAEVPSETRQEWRTPPLWGVRDSGPYLHDGRAKTLHQAILMHGGEAEPMVNRYRDLPLVYRERILAFLNTLTVTDDASPPVSQGDSLAAR